MNSELEAELWRASEASEMKIRVIARQFQLQRNRVMRQGSDVDKEAWVGNRIIAREQ